MADLATREFTFSSLDSIELHAWDWGQEDADKTLVIVHGYGEHGGRYRERAALFAEAGWRVIAPDVRGHGKSQGVRGHVMHFDDYLTDLDLLARHIQTPKERTAILGHSHGGLIVGRRVLQEPTFFSAAVLTSPMFGLAIQAPRWKVSAGRVLSRLLPKLSLPTEIKPEDLSHDPAVAASYEQDPLTHKVVNSRWFTEAMDAIEIAFRDATKVSVPTLVMQAGGDKIVSSEATHRWAGAAPSSCVTYEEIPNAYHELLFEIDGVDHAQRILRFLEAHIA